MYPGVQGGEEGSVGGVAWEMWWSGLDSSCCLYDNCKEKREIHVNMTALLNISNNAPQQELCLSKWKLLLQVQAQKKQTDRCWITTRAQQRLGALNFFGHLSLCAPLNRNKTWGEREQNTMRTANLVRMRGEKSKDRYHKNGWPSKPHHIYSSFVIELIPSYFESFITVSTTLDASNLRELKNRLCC